MTFCSKNLMCFTAAKTSLAVLHLQKIRIQ